MRNSGAIAANRKMMTENAAPSHIPTAEIRWIDFLSFLPQYLAAMTVMPEETPVAAIIRKY